MSYSLVIPYSNPDLDGTACALAYAEFLNKQGQDANAGVFGAPHREAQFVLDKIGLKIQDGSELISAAEDVIVVDASDVRSLPDKLESVMVSKIIDHRQEHHADQFPNADVQIELVGAAATLIAEKFFQNVDISEDAVLLLYGAIISNTMNFQANVTTERDKKMAEWLRGQTHIPEEFTKQMFEHKSAFSEPIKEMVLGDFSTVSYKRQGIGIAQLEIIDVNDFLNQNKKNIQTALKEIENEKNLDHVFLTCADLEDGFNRFVTVDDKTSELLSQSLGVEFEENEAVKDDVLLRKEIIPQIKKVIEGAGQD